MNRSGKIGKIILWVLFWYYLIPYYLLKNYVFKNNRHRVRWASLSSIAIVLILFCCLVNSAGSDDNSTNETATSKPKIHYVVKKVGQKDLAKAETQEKVLSKEKKKDQTEYEKLEQELRRDKAKAKKEKAAALKEEKQNEADNSNSSNAESDYHQVSGGSGNHGDMNTAATGRIVGNRNTKVYHMPGQADYRMSSKNAVYFSSEAQAQAAGYRKAKR